MMWLKKKKKRPHVISKKVLNHIINCRKQKPHPAPTLYALPTGFLPLSSFARKNLYLTNNALIVKSNETDVVKSDLLSTAVGYAGLNSDQIAQQVIRYVSTFKVSTQPSGAHFLAHLKTDHHFATIALLFLSQEAAVERQVLVGGSEQQPECVLTIYVSLLKHGFQCLDQLCALSGMSGADCLDVRISVVDKNKADEISHWLVELRKVLPTAVSAAEIGAAEEIFVSLKNVVLTF